MSEDAPNPAAAPPVRLIPEGVKCVGCDYDLRGLTVDRVCPECGKPIGETVIVDVDELRNAAWVVKVMIRTTRSIAMNFIAALLIFGYVIGPVLLAGAMISTALLARTLRRRPSGDQRRILRWAEIVCWASLLITVAGLVLVFLGDERFNPLLFVAARLSGLMSFAVVIVETDRAIQTCRRVDMPAHLTLKTCLIYAGFAVLMSWMMVLLYEDKASRTNPVLVTAIFLAALSLAILPFVLGSKFDTRRMKLAKILAASCTFHLHFMARSDEERRAIAFKLGRELRQWWK